MKRLLVIALLFFGIVFLTSKAQASTQNIFIDDFQSYNVGATKTELENNSYYYPDIEYYGDLIIKNNNGFVGLGSTDDDGIVFIYDPPTEITTTPTGTRSLFFTIKAEDGVYRDSSWWQVYAIDTNGQSPLGAMFSIKKNGLVRVNDNAGIIHEYTPTDLNNPIDFEITSNQMTGVLTFKINGNIISSSENVYSGNDPIDYFRFNGSSVSAGNNPYIINNVAFVYGDLNPFNAGRAYIWDDWCGNDAGKFLETTPTDLCDIGNASAVVFDGVKWSWDCVDGVVSQNCRSYISTTLPVDGVCGTWAGETFDVWPAKTQLCEPSASLIEGTMTETINGWSWGCAGFNGGSNSVCFADKGVGTLPVYPELPAGTIDDCDGLPLLEGLVCKIGNTIKQIFLPSSEKLNELNQTINKIATKFPFSYISIATDTIKEVGVKINETGDFEMSLLGGEKKSIDFNRIPFAEHIKGFTTTLFILFFLFWLVRYIRHVF